MEMESLSVQNAQLQEEVIMLREQGNDLSVRASNAEAEAVKWRDAYYELSRKYGEEQLNNNALTTSAQMSDVRQISDVADNNDGYDMYPAPSNDLGSDCLPDAISPFPQSPTTTKPPFILKRFVAAYPVQNSTRDNDLVAMRLDDNGGTPVTPRTSLSLNEASTSPSLSSLMDARLKSSGWELDQSVGCPPCGTPERELSPTSSILPDIEVLTTRSSGWSSASFSSSCTTAFNDPSSSSEFQLGENGSHQPSATQAVLPSLSPTISQPEIMDLSRYLSGTTALDIDPRPISVSVSRRALSKSFGIPGMGFLWASKNKQHRFLTPTYDVNPNMPRSPGAPGLLLSCREEVSHNAPWSLLGKIERQKKPLLEYRGEYKCYVVGQMTREEFAAQELSVKQTWGTKIAKHKRYSVYRDMRARMTLRLRYNDEPTEQETIEESELIKGRKYASSLTCDDVIDAFERGDEHIDIVKIVCVSYNHQRAHEFLDAQTNLEAVDAANRAFKTTNTGNKRKNLSTTRPATKMKKARVVWSEDNSESEDDAYSESEEKTNEAAIHSRGRAISAYSESSTSGWDSELTELSDSDTSDSGYCY